MRTKITTLVLLVFFVVGSTTAQERRRQLSSEDMAKRQTETLKEKVSLTDSQQKKVYDIYFKAAEDMKKLRDSGKRDATAFQEKTKATDKAIRGVLTEDQLKKYDKWQEEIQKNREKNRSNRENRDNRDNRGNQDNRRRPNR